MRNNIIIIILLIVYGFVMYSIGLNNRVPVPEVLSGRALEAQNEFIERVERVNEQKAYSQGFDACQGQF